VAFEHPGTSAQAPVLFLMFASERGGEMRRVEKYQKIEETIRLARSAVETLCKHIAENQQIPTDDELAALDLMENLCDQSNAAIRHFARKRRARFREIGAGEV
jgi:hypothetical protein